MTDRPKPSSPQEALSLNIADVMLRQIGNVIRALELPPHVAWFFALALPTTNIFASTSDLTDNCFDAMLYSMFMQTVERLLPALPAKTEQVLDQLHAIMDAYFEHLAQAELMHEPKAGEQN